MDGDSSIDYRIDSFFLVLYIDISLERLSYHFERELKILPDGWFKDYRVWEINFVCQRFLEERKGGGVILEYYKIDVIP